jgi:hypothetical protein
MDADPKPRLSLLFAPSIPETAEPFEESRHLNKRTGKAGSQRGLERSSAVADLATCLDVDPTEVVRILQLADQAAHSPALAHSLRVRSPTGHEAARAR